MLIFLAKWTKPIRRRLVQGVESLWKTLQKYTYIDWRNWKIEDNHILQKLHVNWIHERRDPRNSLLFII